MFDMCCGWLREKIGITLGWVVIYLFTAYACALDCLILLSMFGMRRYLYGGQTIKKTKAAPTSAVHLEPLWEPIVAAQRLN